MAKRNKEHELEPGGGLQDYPESLDRATEAMPENGADSSHAPDDEQKKGKPHEQKLADFSRIMRNRASNVADTMDLIGKLANPAVYAWTEEQENKVFDAFDARTRALREKFAAARAVAEAPADSKGKRVRVHSIEV